MILIWITLLVIGIYLIIKSADWLIESSIFLAKKLKVSQWVIGLTIMAFGTSLPELIISAISSVSGEGSIAIGNIIGSNIANILLILGLGAVITKINISREMTRKEVLYAFLASIVLFFTVGFNLIDGVPPILTRANGLMLLLFLFIYISIAYRNKKQENFKNNEKIEGGIIPKFLLSVLLLFISGELIIRSTVSIATELDISTYILSALIIAIGTSLPELATTVRAAMKERGDLLVGNLIGSNIFNTFGVLGLSAMLRPIAYPPYIISDLFLLLVGSYFVFLLGYFRNKIDKPGGLALISIYVIYTLTLILRYRI